MSDERNLMPELTLSTETAAAQAPAAPSLTLDASADARAARRATVAARFGDLEVARRYLKLLFP